MASGDSTSSSQRGVLSEDCCKSCKRQIDLNSRFECRLCKSIFHRDKVCSGLNANVIRSANDNRQILIMCHDCSQRLVKLEARVAHLEQTKDRTDNTDTKLKTDLVSEAINEFQERDRKKDNLILFNVPESTHVNDPEKEDCDYFKSICTSLSVKDVRFTSLKRIGRKTDKPRPVIVTFASQESRRAMLYKAKNLRKLSDDHPLKPVVIKMDLTKSQQQAEKLLQVSLKSRREAGDDCVIWRGKVVLRSEINRHKPKDK